MARRTRQKHRSRAAGRSDDSLEDRGRDGAGAASPVPVRPKGTLDLVAAAVLAVVAVFAVAFLSEGSLFRVALVLPVLFLVPGYLLLQALPIPIFGQWSRGVHAFLAIGISPALVGLLALATTLFPGGFRPTPIVLSVTLAALALAAVAFFRRSRMDTSGRGAQPEAA